MKITALFLVLVCGSSIAVEAQNPYFRLLSFVVDDKEVIDYSVVFVVGDQRHKAVRTKDRIYMPGKISGISEATVEFQTDDLRISFPYVQIGGYLDTDAIKQDYKLRVDRPPFRSEIVAKYDVSKICRIDTLTRTPRLASDSKLIVDPVTFTLLKRCEK